MTADRIVEQKKHGQLSEYWYVVVLQSIRAGASWYLHELSLVPHRQEKLSTCLEDLRNDRVWESDDELLVQVSPTPRSPSRLQPVFLPLRYVFYTRIMQLGIIRVAPAATYQ